MLMEKEKDKTDLSYLVSNYDIEGKFKHGNVKIITYPELKDYNNIDELVPEEISACFILLETSKKSGHWTVVGRHDDTLYYFDSYGVAPDGELKNISKSLRYELGEDHHYLIYLFHHTDKYVYYNHFQYQSYHKGINTCGKWCVVFTKAVFAGVTLKGFKAGIEHLKKIYTENNPGDKDYVLDRIANMLYVTY